MRGVSLLQVRCGLVCLLAALSIVPAVSASSSEHVLPRKRHYDTHHYYAIELRSVSDPLFSDVQVDPRSAAEALGAEFVEQVGELRNHWLVRSPKKLVEQSSEGMAKRQFEPRDYDHSEDPVLRRWEQVRQARSSGRVEASLPARHVDVFQAIRSVERQDLRMRHKRNRIISPWDTPELYPEARMPIPGPLPHPYPDPEEVRRPPVIPAAVTAKMMGQFGIRDPIFAEQWHLANDKILGNDLNTSGVWAQGFVGKGINVALIDDGLDMHSPDLAANFFPEGSYDFNDHTALPAPRLSDDQHGTRCAGEIAAVKNDVCGVGVAYEAHVAGLRILSGPISDADEAAALNYRYQDNHIYSCSWGPPDDGKSMDAPKGLIAKAMLNGVQNGRGGKGSIYVFAGGNGGASDDQCNFDGYTNSIYSMTIAAVDREGKHPYYSEMCSANLASGWSSGSMDHIHTTDVAWNGVNKCTSMHGGTSAAAPLVAGVVALALQARPDLTWRDVQHIAVRSAQMINPDDKDWQTTQAGRHYNHKYGYGVIDAYAFVEEAKKHKLVTPQAWFTSDNITIPADETFIGTTGVSKKFTVTEGMLRKANLKALEHVSVKVWISHDQRGDVDVELTSPHGTKSVLARPRRYDEAKTGFPGWSFTSLKHWDEDPVGDWTIKVSDGNPDHKVGNFYAWGLTLWGSSLDPALTRPWDFPQDSVEFHETLASAPKPTTGAPLKTHPKPTQHLPGDHGTAAGESHVDFTNGPGGTGGNMTKPEADTGYIAGLKKNSTWLFVAAGVVFIFASSVAAFFVLRKRRNAKGRGGDYEFVPAADDDLPLGALERGRGRGGKSASARRTKDLYDAFAEAGSEEDDDDEDDAALLAHQHQQAAYRDVPDDEGGDNRFAIDDEDDTHGQPPRYRDDEDGESEKLVGKGKGKARDVGVGEEKEVDLLGDSKEDRSSGSGSGGSWQDAGAA